MSILRLEDLLSKLPKGPSLRLEQKSHPAVSLPSIDTAFLQPGLREIEGTAEIQKCPIVVISAPGAVGKSALAQHISAQKNLFLWDLSRLKLGDNSFIGTIANCFGTTSLALVLKDLEQASTGFVFDALDEAEILSGWQRVENFLDELCKYTKSANKPCIVLLARSESASLVSLYLRMNDVSFFVLEIDYFTEEQSKVFISLQMKKLSIDRQHAELYDRYLKFILPFNNAIDAIYQAIYQAFSYKDGNAWADNSIKSFLGYAPVLQAIGAYMATFTNFQDVPKAVKADFFDAKDSDIASKIMDDLLKREQGKLLGALRARKIPGSETWNEWERLYSAPEQLERMLHFVLGNTDVAKLESDGSLPGWLIDNYRDAVKTMLPQHPFIRKAGFAGPAFRDYALANLLKSNHSNTRKMTRSILQLPTYVATPLLLQFYKADGTELIWGEDAGFFYESVSSRDTITNLSSAIIMLPPSVSGNKLHAFELFDDESIENGTVITLYIRNSTATNIVFNRRMRNALLSVDGTLTLGHESNDFEITDSEILCKNLELRSSTLIVQSAYIGQATTIRAKEYTQIPPTLEIRKRGPGALFVSWPSAKQHPWSSFAYEGNGDSKDEFGLDAYLGLRRIFTWFKRDKKIDLARHQDLIRNAAVGDNRLRQLLLQYLIELQIIFEDHPLLKVNTQLMSRFGINYSDLRKCNKTQSIDSFLMSFRKWIDKKAG
jgi:hypothetical protein